MEGGADEDVEGGASLQMRDVQEHRVKYMQVVNVIGGVSGVWVADRSYLLPLVSSFGPEPRLCEQIGQ